MLSSSVVTTLKAKRFCFKDGLMIKWLCKREEGRLDKASLNQNERKEKRPC